MCTHAHTCMCVPANMHTKCTSPHNVKQSKWSQVTPSTHPCAPTVPLGAPQKTPCYIWGRWESSPACSCWNLMPNLTVNAWALILGRSALLSFLAWTQALRQEMSIPCWVPRSQNLESRAICCCPVVTCGCHTPALKGYSRLPEAAGCWTVNRNHNVNRLPNWQLYSCTLHGHKN